MRGNTVPIEVELKRGKVAKTIALYQYDYGQKLIFTNVDLPPYYEVHFSNEMHGEAITSIGDETGVEIPDDFLATGLPVYLWLFLHAGSSDGETEYQGVIPVIKRASISDQEPTPTQQTAIEQAIEALNAAIESSDASDSEAWAIGKRGTQDVSSDDETYHNNSKYYAGQASDSATSAGGSATSAGTDALKAEGYAVGKQNGTDVGSGSPYYENNAKYYATQASDSATSASGSASAADDSAEDAEAYAVGKRDGVDVTSDDPAYHNNSKYYATEAAASALEATTAAASASAAYGTALLAPDYSSSSTYAVGDHVIYGGNYYECNTAITSGEAWTAAHWTQLTVGGETSALKSAFDDESYNTQKKIGNIVEIIDERIHGSSQKWISDSGYHYYLYPISGNDAIVIKAQSGYSAYYQVLAGSDHTVNTTPEYATGYSGGEIKVNGGATASITAPSDARYLMINDTVHQPTITVNGSNLYDMFSSENIPLRVKTVENKVASIEVFDKTVEIDLGLYVVIENERIHASSETWISDSGYLYNLYPITGSDAIVIKAKSGYSAYYTLLKDSAHVVGTSPHYATGYSGGTTKINGGQTATITAPSDAKYLMIDVASHAPTVTINGTNTDDVFSDENMSKRVKTVEKSSSYIDENTYNITDNTLEDRKEVSDISVLKDNLGSMLKYKNGLQSATQRINFSETSKKKQIFHIHRRENNGFDSGFNVYLPNAQKDFSDLRFISDTGKYLPYHFVYRGNIDILQDSRLGFDSKCRMYQNSYGTIISAVNSQIKTSDDNGETWTVISALSSFDNPRVLGISTQDTLFFEKLGVLYRSAYPYTDYTEVYDHTAGKTGPAINGYGFVVHPSGPMFFGAYQLERVIEIYKSTDDGLNWTRVYYLEETYQHVHSMSVDTNQNPIAVYAGLDGGGGVLKTTDLGSTWTNLRELHPTMQQSTDYGVIGCGNGFRLLGGETPVVGGDSIIRTTDDSTFTPVLSIGNGFMKAESIGEKLFAGGTAANYFRNSEIMMSEDNGQTWTQVFTASDIREDGVTDGLKYVSKLHDNNADEDYIVITCQHHTLPPVRIYSGGDNYYAEVIVEIPQGCNYVDVENGYLCQNRTIIGYDYQNDSAKIVDFGLNEGKCIKESVSGNIYRGDFGYINTGRYLDDIYPYIINPSDRYSIALESMIGSDFTLPQNFTTLDGITISFWFRAGSSIDVRLLTFGEHMLRFKNYTIYDGNTSFAVLRGIIFQNTLVKADVVIDFTNDKVKTFINGVKETDKTDTTGLIALLAQYNGNVKYLDVQDCSHSDILQHFTVYGSVLSDAAIKESYVCGVK